MDREKALIGAGEAIRERALFCKRPPTATKDEDEEELAKKDARVRHALGFALEKASMCILDTAERQKVVEEKHFALDECRLLLGEESARKGD